MSELEGTKACLICQRADRRQLEALMVTEPEQAVADLAGLDVRTVRLHRDKHLPEVAALAVRGAEVTHARFVVDELQGQLARAKELEEMALETEVDEETGERKPPGPQAIMTALAAIGRQTKILEAFARMALYAAMTKNAPLGPNAPNWSSMTLEQRIEKARELRDHFDQALAKYEVARELSRGPR